MSKIYAFVNQKGGVGKTTSVVNIGAYLADAGQRVLLIDLDSQANATSCIGFDKYAVESSVYEVMLGNQDIQESLLAHETIPNLSIMPSKPALAGAEAELVNAMNREYRLRRALAQIDAQFDYVLIDCPPSLGLLTVNALTAAKDGVIIPIQTEYLALEGLTQLLQTIDLVKVHLNPDLTIRGLIMTMHDGRTNLSRDVLYEVKKHFPDKVFHTIIPRNIRLSEAPSHGVPVNAYAPQSVGAISYKVLTDEILREDLNIAPVQQS